MLRLVWRHVRTRPYRSVSLLAIVFLVAVGFSVLTAGVERSRLVVQDFVDEHARAAYDILVRPSHAVEPRETELELVRPGYLAGLRHGLTVEQWRRVQDIAGVEVAAPAGVEASIGVRLTARVDVTDLLDPRLGQQVVRVWPTHVADAGLTRAVDPDPRFVYVTDRPVAVTTFEAQLGDLVRFSTPDGTVEQPVPGSCISGVVGNAIIEQQPSGRWEPLCGTRYAILDAPTGVVTRPRYNAATFAVFQARPNGSYLDFTAVTRNRFAEGVEVYEPTRASRVVVQVEVPLWLPVGVVDPVQEDRLVALGSALVSGDPLPPGPAPAVRDVPDVDVTRLRVPMLASAELQVREQLELAVAPLGSQPVLTRAPEELWQELSDVDASPARVDRVEIADLYRSQARSLRTRLDFNLFVGRPTLVAGANRLGVTPVDFVRHEIFETQSESGSDAQQPLLAGDVAFRLPAKGALLEPEDAGKPPLGEVRGVFRPELLAGFSEFSRVSLELYDSTVEAVGPGGTYQLAPTSAPTGYLAIPPAVLITVEAAQQLTGRDDVIGAIRVRVRGVEGVDPASRERVRLVAEQLAAMPGVTVDIALGSSPAAQEIALPAGRFGRPALVLHEPWSVKGTAIRILRAAETKNLLLLALTFLACIAMLSNATGAAVRERRQGLAVLSGLGWARGRILSVLMVESALLGLVAGALALPAGYALSRAITADASLARGAWAVPAAVLVTSLASFAPAWRAASVDPVAGMAPAVAPVARRQRLSGRWAMAMTNLLRNKARTVGALVALAVAVATVSLLVAVLLVFDGTVVGTLLGDAVSLRVGPTDLVLLVVLSVVGLASIADVVYVGLRERASELALLRAIGWANADVMRVVLIEGAMLGTAGSMAGAALAAAIMWVVFGTLGVVTVAVLLMVAVGAALAGILASLLPGLTLPRRGTVSVLSEEG